ncbi:MAG: hypothetical protein E5X64_11470 [Mesorhizobium sp.]|nr:MAG: hypothetical protein E5X64_11470 [Mesorhizobium sp.]
MSSVIDGSFESGWCQQPDLTGELSMTTAKPLARYSAIEGALASGFATAELHHLWGRDHLLPYPHSTLWDMRQCPSG